MDNENDKPSPSFSSINAAELGIAQEEGDIPLSPLLEVSKDTRDSILREKEELLESDAEMKKYKNWRLMLMISFVILVGGCGAIGLILQYEQISLVQNDLFEAKANVTLVETTESIVSSFENMAKSAVRLSEVVWSKNLTLQTLDSAVSMLPSLYSEAVADNRILGTFVLSWGNGTSLYLGRLNSSIYASPAFAVSYINTTLDSLCATTTRYLLPNFIRSASDVLIAMHQNYNQVGKVALKKWGRCHSAWNKGSVFNSLEYKQSSFGPTYYSPTSHSVSFVHGVEISQEATTAPNTGAMVGATFNLETLSTYLRFVASAVSKNTRIFVIDSDNKLLAVSHGRIADINPVYVSDQSDVRYAFNESNDNVIQKVGSEIFNRDGSFFPATTRGSTFFRMEIAGVAYLVDIGLVLPKMMPARTRVILASPVDEISGTIGSSAAAMIVASVLVIVLSSILALVVSAMISLPIRSIVSLQAILRHQQVNLANKNRALEAMTLHAENVSKAKSDFLGTISHEIRTPLNGIIGMVELLMVNTDPTRQQLDYLDTIQMCGRAELDLLSQVLDFAKVESGDVVVEPASTDVRQLLAEAIEVAAATQLVRGTKISFGNLMSPQVPQKAMLDSRKVRQILLNYCGNAVRYGRGGFALTFGSVVEVDGTQMLRITVKDNGIGIPPDVIPQLFSRFEQGSASVARRQGGTGLGLAISRKLAVSMGGSVGVDSIEGVGSEFWVQLPLVAVPVDESKSTASPSPNSAPTAILPDLVDSTNDAVLIVAESDERLLIQEVLRDSGLNILVCDDWREAAALMMGQARMAAIEPLHWMSKDHLRDAHASSSSNKSKSKTARVFAVVSNDADADENEDEHSTKTKAPVRFGIEVELESGSTSTTEKTSLNVKATIWGCGMLFREASSVPAVAASMVMDGNEQPIAKDGAIELFEELSRRSMNGNGYTMPPFIAVVHRMPSKELEIPYDFVTVRSPLVGDQICELLVHIFENGGSNGIGKRGNSHREPVLLSSPNSPHLELSLSTKEIVMEMKNLLSHKNVLVVDDNAVNLSLAVGMMKKGGCKIKTAMDGEQAVNHVKEALDSNSDTVLPDIILMDVQMPVLNGLEATKIIRRMLDDRDKDKNESVRILGLTALAFEEDRVRCLESGMTSWMSKPFTLIELYVSLRDMLKSEEYFI